MIGSRNRPILPITSSNFANMRVGEIALKRGRLNEFDRQSRQHDPASAIGLSIDREDLPAITLDCSMQFGDICRRSCGLEFGRGQTGRHMSGLATTSHNTGGTRDFGSLPRHRSVW